MLTHIPTLFGCVGKLRGTFMKRAQTRHLLHTSVPPLTLRRLYHPAIWVGASQTTFGTHGDAQLSYRVRSNEIPGESQVHVSGPLSIAHTDPADPGQEKGVILNPISSDSKNQIVFDDISRTVLLNPNDLVLIQPGADLYIRRFIVDHGIQLDIHGTVRDIRVGAGSKNLRSCMPSIFDTLDNKKRIYGAIPGIVAFILGLFEAVGLLPRKSK
jgi:hypothetical protein